MKREDLSKTEAQKLRDFVTDCVMSNVTFPPTQIGGQSITIQDLLHSRTVDSLGKYADFLEQQGGKISRADRILGVEEKTIGSSKITFAQAISTIDLIIKHKLAEDQRASLVKKRIAIKAELDNMKTPKEKKAELEKELANLDKVL
jgi:hypothetical protein